MRQTSDVIQVHQESNNSIDDCDDRETNFRSTRFVVSIDDHFHSLVDKLSSRSERLRLSWAAPVRREWDFCRGVVVG